MSNEQSFGFKGECGAKPDAPIQLSPSDAPRCDKIRPMDTLIVSPDYQVEIPPEIRCSPGI